MHRILILILILTTLPAFLAGAPSMDILTEEETILLQENRGISRRVQIFMDAAMLRLKAAEDRLNGKEPEEGDPFEFLAPGDLLHNYCRILTSLMFSVDEAYGDPGRDRNIKKTLESLKERTEKTARQLEVLKKIAENRKDEKLWDLVSKAVEVTGNAHEGAESGLSELSSD